MHQIMIYYILLAMTKGESSLYTVWSGYGVFLWCEYRNLNFNIFFYKSIIDEQPQKALPSSTQRSHLSRF